VALVEELRKRLSADLRVHIKHRDIDK